MKVFTVRNRFNEIGGINILADFWTLEGEIVKFWAKNNDGSSTLSSVVSFTSGDYICEVKTNAAST